MYSISKLYEGRVVFTNILYLIMKISKININNNRIMLCDIVKTVLVLSL